MQISSDENTKFPLVDLTSGQRGNQHTICWQLSVSSTVFLSMFSSCLLFCSISYSHLPLLSIPSLTNFNHLPIFSHSLSLCSFTNSKSLQPFSILVPLSLLFYLPLVLSFPLFIPPLLPSSCLSSLPTPFSRLLLVLKLQICITDHFVLSKLFITQCTTYMKRGSCDEMTQQLRLFTISLRDQQGEPHSLC